MVDQFGRQRVTSEIHFVMGQESQAVKVKEQRLLVWRLRDVPWGPRPLRVAQHVDLIAKTLWPVIQILLIAELAILWSCEAPFHAALLPPLPHRFATVSGECDELHTVAAVCRRLVVLGGVGMICDQHLFPGLLELSKYRSRGG